MDNMETATIRPGALILILQIARIAGVAPLSFEKLRDGYNITVSRFQLVYSFFFLTAFNLAGLVGLSLNLKDKKLVDFQSHSATLLILSERTTCIITCGMGYMAAIRMKNMINYINIVEKIRTKINYVYNFAKEDSIVKWISLFIIISNFIFTLLETTFIMLRASECDFGVILLAISYLQYNILIVLKVQIVVTNFEVYKVLLELNARLRYILTLTNSDHLTTAKQQAINNGIRNLTQCYVSVCEVVTKINNVDGLYIFLIYTSLALFSVFDGFRLILALNKPSTQYSLADIILQTCWCILIILRVFFFVEPYQRISVQVAEMKVLLAQLMYHMTPLGNLVSIALDVMMKQVILNAPKYCPLGLNTLNRSLIIITLNAMITFLVFMVQIQST